ncbi:MAG: putative phage-type endonuclease [Fusobacteria bacterium]|nr:MAG: putative phage-type endonuclease [Fusobacteriota bacterium]KAF0228947.1 MAG: putative phage-type [Fusobacteriota bacterium]
MINNEKDWLQERLKGIGGSEASAIIGKNPYMSNQVLWELKVGLKEHEDIGNKPCVQYGKEAEAPLRELFKLDFPKYEVQYKDFDLIRHDKHQFILATLDGRLIEKETGRIGILEIKTTEILRSMQKEKWNQGIPDNYYIQVLWQLLATGYDFAVLKAQLKYQYSGEVRTESKHYFIERSEVQEDIDYLEEVGIKFWEHVENKNRPPLILPEL